MLLTRKKNPSNNSCFHLFLLKRGCPILPTQLLPFHTLFFSPDYGSNFFLQPPRSFTRRPSSTSHRVGASISSGLLTTLPWFLKVNGTQESMPAPSNGLPFHPRPQSPLLLPIPPCLKPGPTTGKSEEIQIFLSLNICSCSSFCCNVLLSPFKSQFSGLSLLSSAFLLCFSSALSSGPMMFSAAAISCSTSVQPSSPTLETHQGQRISVHLDTSSIKNRVTQQSKGTSNPSVHRGVNR